MMKRLCTSATLDSKSSSCKSGKNRKRPGHVSIPFVVDNTTGERAHVEGQTWDLRGLIPSRLVPLRSLAFRGSLPPLPRPLALPPLPPLPLAALGPFPKVKCSTARRGRLPCYRAQLEMEQWPQVLKKRRVQL